MRPGASRPLGMLPALLAVASLGAFSDPLDDPVFVVPTEPEPPRRRMPEPTDVATLSFGDEVIAAGRLENIDRGEYLLHPIPLAIDERATPEERAVRRGPAFSAGRLTRRERRRRLGR